MTRLKARITVIVAAALVGAVAVPFAVAQPNLDDAGTRAFLVALLVPYVVTWLALGVHLLRGLPAAEHASGG